VIAQTLVDLVLGVLLALEREHLRGAGLAAAHVFAPANAAALVPSLLTPTSAF
jgi:hypothetical protein